MNEPVLQRERGGRPQPVKGTVRLREANANLGALKAERRALFYLLCDFALIYMWGEKQNKKNRGQKRFDGKRRGGASAGGKSWSHFLSEKKGVNIPRMRSAPRGSARYHQLPQQRGWFKENF